MYVEITLVYSPDTYSYVLKHYLLSNIMWTHNITCYSEKIAVTYIFLYSLHGNTCNVGRYTQVVNAILWFFEIRLLGFSNQKNNIMRLLLPLCLKLNMYQYFAHEH